jgi:hypothetical protein
MYNVHVHVGCVDDGKQKDQEERIKVEVSKMINIVHVQTNINYATGN